MSGYAFTFGETMGLYRATELGGLETATDARLGVGGADSNVAIGIRRLGGEAVWTGRVGDDGLGRRVVRELRAEGVEVRAVVDAAAQTGLMLKEKRTSETTRVYFYRAGSAGSRLAAHDLDPDLIRGAAVLHVTGITAALSDSAREAVDRAITIARDAGVTVSFDVNHRPSLWPSGDPGALYRELAARSDIVFAGDDEARLLVPDAGAAPVDLAAALAELGPSEVVIKLGAAGSLSLIDGAWFPRDAHRVLVVDSVGAGDAFVAGYLAARMRGAGVAERLQQATEAGAFACLGPGDWESLPRSQDLALLHTTEPVAR